MAIGIACFSLASGARAADPDAVRRIVDAAIEPVMAEHAVPGMAVAVTVDGRAMYFNYGLASKEDRLAVSEHTLFELGSISKAFTATLACQAEAAGALSLEDKPGKYLPALKGSAVDRASLLELGTYTAGGLPLQFPDQVTSEETMLAYFRQWQPDAAPGMQRRYSNPSIGLMGRATALALKSDFGAALETQLFPRFGMRNSFVRVPAQASYAWGYDRGGKPVRVSPDVFDAEAYGVKSSSADMIRFVQANMAPENLDAATRRAVACTQAGRFDMGEMVQGLGWEQYPYPVALSRLLAGNSAKMSQSPNPARRLEPPRAPGPDTLFNKTGATRGFGAYVAFVPAQRIGVVLLANRALPVPARVTAAHAILERLARP